MWNVSYERAPMSVSIRHSAVNLRVEKTAQLPGWCCLCSSYSDCGLQQQYDPGYESAQGQLNNSTKKKLQADLEFFSSF